MKRFYFAVYELSDDVEEALRLAGIDRHPEILITDADTWDTRGHWDDRDEFSEHADTFGLWRETDCLYSVRSGTVEDTVAALIDAGLVPNSDILEG